MKLLHIIIPLKVIAISVFVFNLTNGEQVFVLEAADSSDSPQVSSGAELTSPTTTTTIRDDPNTKIITDDSSTSNQATHQATHRLNETQVRNNQLHNQKYSNQASTSAQSNQHPKALGGGLNVHNSSPKQQVANEQYRQPEAPTSTPTSTTQSSTHSRRLEEENGAQQRRQSNIASVAMQQSSNTSGTNKHNKASLTPSTTTHSDQQRDSVPKSEERLLISITSEDPDEGAYVHSKPPHKLDDDLPQVSSSNQAQHQHQKRKPSIMISIQDANKQNGGQGGTPAVIVTPGEDGKSIVIATVNNNAGNKYKPSSQSGDSALTIPIASINAAGYQSGNSGDPYREPINTPIQSIIQQHQVTSTTRRPQALGDYGSSSSSGSGSANSRPITSTLVDRPRPPTNVLADERPPHIITPPINLDTTNNHNHNNNNNNEPSHPSQATYDSQTARPPEYEQTSRPLSSNHNNNNDPYASETPRFPLNEKNCGIMHETRIVGGDVADPDDFMWMAAIIKSRPRDGEPRPFCGGSLITRRHILTAAHCLENLAPRDVLVRLGSYDFEDSASSTSADYAIDQFRVPAQYSKKTHVADIAIMRLKTPLQVTDNYKTVCMPQARRSYVGSLGTVTGYGSQSQTFRRAAPKLRQVTVPIWENRKCSVVYKKNLTESFLCAGYEEGGKDACQGDSGGPLMTEGPDQKMMIVGVVSHGIGCGAPGYPGVYTRTSTFTDWIEKNTRE